MKAKVFLLIGGGSTVFHPPLSPAVPHTCTVKKLSPGPHEKATGCCRIVMLSSILVECFDNIIILKRPRPGNKFIFVSVVLIFSVCALGTHY